jgi:chaperonin GroEL
MRQLVTNAGREAALIVEKVKELPVTTGYDIKRAAYVDMLEAGVIDPAKVIRVALQNSSSVAGLMLTTECIITDIKEDSTCHCKTSAPPMPGLGF